MLQFCVLYFSLGNNIIRERGRQERRRDMEVKQRKSSRNLEKRPKSKKRKGNKETKEKESKRQKEEARK